MAKGSENTEGPAATESGIARRMTQITQKGRDVRLPRQTWPDHAGCSGAQVGNGTDSLGDSGAARFERKDGRDARSQESRSLWSRRRGFHLASSHL